MPEDCEVDHLALQERGRRAQDAVVIALRQDDVLPRLAGSPGLEPLLAFYGGRCRRVFEAQLARDDFSPLRLGEHPRVITPLVPSDLAHAWYNVNSPEECPPHKS